MLWYILLVYIANSADSTALTIIVSGIDIRRVDFFFVAISTYIIPIPNDIHSASVPRNLESIASIISMNNAPAITTSLSMYLFNSFSGVNFLPTLSS